MIRAVLFDLDGTLVETEKLKAISYALAVQKLRGLDEPDNRAMSAYIEVVGAAREVATKHVMAAVAMSQELSPLLAQYDATEPWQVLSRVRLEIYADLMAEPKILLESQCRDAVRALHLAKERLLKSGLATSSSRRETLRILSVLGLMDLLDVVLTADDVTKGKPDPEIYIRAAQILGVEPADCLVLEDSAAGVQAAASAGMNVLAVATSFTETSLHERSWQKAVRITDPDSLLQLVRDAIAEG